MRFEIIRKRPKTAWHAIWGILAVLIIALVGLAKNLPLYSMPCIFHELTGFPCLTCGGIRCVVSLSNFELLDAFFYNPLVAITFISMVLSFIVILAGLITGLSLKVNFNSEATRVIRYIAIAGILINWTFLAMTGR